MPDVNQNPEQMARDRIDEQLRTAGWGIQNRNVIDFNAGLGIAAREYQTDIGPADYVLFVERQPVGVVEAKSDTWGVKLTTVEEQSEGYARAKLKWVAKEAPLPFLYESTGQITRFTNGRDPNPRSREVFTFHRPETFKDWMLAPRTFREGIAALPQIIPTDLRECQVKAISNLEVSLKADKPRALVQMATGSGKTFTAIAQVYRLLKHADARRILFLVDTRNLGEQAEQEFMAFVPNDDNRKFTELYNVQRLASPSIANDVQVFISTIQRMYATLKGEDLTVGADEDHPEEQNWQRKEPLPVVYNAKLPPEHFDVVVIDECHRSIYNLWRQVVEYFDAFLIGLTATPDNRTFGFFQKNVVSEYTHEQAVADKVNVGNEIYLIETQVTQSGETIRAEQLVEKRERQTRARRWEIQDEPATYTATQLDHSVVNPDQIRTVIRAFHDNWAEIFPGRKELPKTLIFAKTDSHADDIIQTVRQEFGESNEFCRKITNAAKNPKSSLTAFRSIRFLYYLFISLRLGRLDRSTAIPGLNRDDVHGLSVPIPPLSEQGRIVDKIEVLFDEIDGAVESLQAAKTTVELIRQSLLKSAFEGRLTANWRAKNPDKLESPDALLARIRAERERSCQVALEEWRNAFEESRKDVGRPIVSPPEWLWLTLSSLGRVTGGLTKNQKRNSLQRKAKYLRVANVYSNRLELDEIMEVGITEDEFQKTRLIAGGLLFVEGNGSIEQIGRVAIWDGCIPEVTHQNHLVRFGTSGILSPRFALHFMISPLGRAFITAQASSTSGLHTLSISKVKKLLVPVPSLAEQAEIVRILDARLEAVEALNNEIDTNLARAESLRQSILIKAFSGQLVPQDPADEPATALLRRIKSEAAAAKRKPATRKHKVPIE